MSEKRTLLKEIATAEFENILTQLAACIPFLHEDVERLKQIAAQQEPRLRQFLEKEISKRETLLARLENAVGQTCPKEKK